MANEKNLIPNSVRTPSERRENARKAGLASGEARKRYKSLRQMAKNIGSTVDKKSGKTNNELMLLSMYLAAQNGNVAAFKELIELLGEKQSKQEVNVTIRKKAPEGTDELYKKIRDAYGGEAD